MPWNKGKWKSLNSKGIFIEKSNLEVFQPNKSMKEFFNPFSPMYVKFYSKKSIYLIYTIFLDTYDLIFNLDT